MVTVRTVVHPGWLVVRGPQVEAVVAVADPHSARLEEAAADGLPTLLEALTTHGLSAVPDLAACAHTPTGLRLVLRGAAVAVLPDGTRLDAQGRLPWLDVDLDLPEDDEGEVVLEAPAPPRSRGWRRPARLTRPAVPEPPASDDSPADESAASSEEPTVRVAAPTLEVPVPASAQEESDAEDDSGPLVLAVLCPAGHPSPPDSGQCRSCALEIPPQQPRLVPRPTLGTLLVSTGERVPLDRGVLLGRAPRVDDDLPEPERPHVLRVGGPARDISRSHAEVVLDGWQVLVRDLGSTNGTTVALPGSEPERLHPNEARAIQPGTVVGLAREVELTYALDG